jgi:GntR family transcriptional regulator, histidine utilization repressor
MTPTWLPASAHEASTAELSPLYRRVKSNILERIQRGELKVLDRVPSENDLVEELGVSRMTANRALRELADEGILVRVSGVGTFVADKRVHSHPLEVRNIADEIRSRGHRYSSKVLTLETIRADEALATSFGLAIHAPVYRAVVLHCENDLPLQLEDRFVSPVAVPGFLDNDFRDTTPYEVLMRMAPLHQAEHVLQAVMPDAKLRKLLNLDADEACLLIRRRTWSRGQVATLADLYHPGKRYELAGTFKPLS